MPTYQFSCSTHGPFDATLTMAELTDTHPCRECTEPSRRVFSPPQLRLGDSRARALIDATARTADQPAVVSGPPGRPSRPRRAADPRTAKLPRP